VNYREKNTHCEKKRWKTKIEKETSAEYKREKKESVM